MSPSPGDGNRGVVVREFSYKVRVWEIRVYEHKHGGRSFQVRWAVAGAAHHERFQYRGLARSFQARLISAASMILTDPVQLAAILHHLAHRNDGQPCSPRVTRRRRSTLHSILDHAVQHRLLPTNPLLFNDWNQ